MADEMARFTGTKTAYQYDEMLGKAKSEARHGGGHGGHALSGAQFGEQVARFGAEAERLSPEEKREPQKVDVHVHQDQAPERQPQRPEYADGRYDGPDVQVPKVAGQKSIGDIVRDRRDGVESPEMTNPNARAVFGRKIRPAVQQPTVSAQPLPGSNLGGQFATEDQMDALRARLSGQDEARTPIGDLVRQRRNATTWSEEPKTPGPALVNSVAGRSFARRGGFTVDAAQTLSSGQFQKPSSAPVASPYEEHVTVDAFPSFVTATGGKPQSDAGFEGLPGDIR